MKGRAVAENFANLISSTPKYLYHTHLVEVDAGVVAHSTDCSHLDQRIVVAAFDLLATQISTGKQQKDFTHNLNPSIR